MRTLQRRLGTAVTAVPLAAGLAVPAHAETAPAATAAAACSFEWREPYMYAGHSNTLTAITKKGHSGSRVREVQCLLLFFSDYHDDPKLSARGVDGVFGDNTRNAVLHAQRHYLFPGNGREWDGEVGPKTWPGLRRLSFYPKH
jgi:peptidoglycan hydrolase-like protein with peptidoglycan-binding domain